MMSRQTMICQKCGQGATVPQTDREDVRLWLEGKTYGYQGFMCQCGLHYIWRPPKNREKKIVDVELCQGCSWCSKKFVRGEEE